MKIHAEKQLFDIVIRGRGTWAAFDRRPGTSGPKQDRALARVLQSNMEVELAEQSANSDLVMNDEQRVRA